MQLAGNSSTFLVLNAKQSPAQLAQRFFRIAAGRNVHHNDSQLRENPAIFLNREVIDEPVAKLTGFGRQIGGNLAVEHRLASTQNFLQQQIGMHAALTENFGGRPARQLLRLHPGHSWECLVEARTPEFGIENDEADSGR